MLFSRSCRCGSVFSSFSGEIATIFVGFCTRSPSNLTLLPFCIPAFFLFHTLPILLKYVNYAKF